MLRMSESDWLDVTEAVTVAVEVICGRRERAHTPRGGARWAASRVLTALATSAVGGGLPWWGGPSVPLWCAGARTRGGALPKREAAWRYDHGQQT